MIDFKEQDGELFRMLEKPVPLTPDAEMPCLVQLIQDNSPMGRNNKNRFISYLEQKFIIKELDDGKYVEIEKWFFPAHNSRFEIIGYPVADGSKDWALYQMMQGEKVTKRHLINHIYWHYDARPHLKCISEYNCGTLQIMVLPEIWLTTAEPTGWQIYKEPKPEPEPKERPLRNLILRAKEQGMNIRTWYQDLIFTPESLTSYLNNGKYRWWNIGDWELTKREANMPMPEPKPLLADAKVGDLCKTDLDEWIQIDDTFERPSPILYHFDRPFKGNIIHTEPLAPEGSAEWAWQMAKLGIETKCIYGKIRISDSGMIEVCYNGMAYAMPLTQSAENRKYVINKIRECSPDGWQLYEPKPEQQNPMPTTEFVDLSDAPAGWICKTRDGGNYPLKYIEVSPTRYAYEDKSGLTVYVMANGRYKKNGTDGRDIIACEPEPEPAMQYKVGDWVKYDIDSYLQVIAPSGKERTWCRTLSGIMVYPYTSLLTKVSPADVVIHIGCLSGTVRPVSTNGIHIWFHLIGVDDKTIATIRIESLDTETRGLVESLLKAMQEKEK